MEKKQILGVIGLILLIVGLFLPIIKIPINDNINFYGNNRAEAMVIAALSVLSLIFILIKRYSLLWIPVIAIIAVMSVLGIDIAMRVMNAKSKAEGIIGEELTEEISEGVTQIVTDHVQIQWGVVVLAAGILLIILCAIIGSIKKKLPMVDEQQ